MYPKDLIPLLRDHARRRRDSDEDAIVLPTDSVLEQILDVAFHASFAVEEGRRPGFRIVLQPPGKSKPGTSPFLLPDRVIQLSPSRPYTAAELTRLAPAADLFRTLIGINATRRKGADLLQIWGLLDIGASWHNFVRHESSGAHPPPSRLTVTSLNPGEISVSTGGDVLATLRDGRISEPSARPLWAGPVSDFADQARKRLYNDVVASLNVKRWDAKGDDDEYPFRYYTHFIERILFHIREKRHGGSLLIVPDYFTLSDTRLTDRIRIKYACDYDAAWGLLTRYLTLHHKFYQIHLPLWKATKAIPAATFQVQAVLGTDMRNTDTAIGDVASAIAGFTGVDGTVVVTDRFRILGFGAEVVVPSPTLRNVKIVSGEAERTVEIDSFGTRHRSAFRFCSSFDDCVALVVSQDGAVRAVKRVGADVVMWDDINAGAMGI